MPASKKPKPRSLAGKKTLGVRLDPADRDAVQRLARSAGLTPSDYVRELIKERIGKKTGAEFEPRFEQIDRALVQLRFDLATVARFLIAALGKVPLDSPEFADYDREIESELKRLLRLE